MSAPTFFQQRMAALGITEDLNTVTVFDPMADFPLPSEYLAPVFSEVASTGDIEILITRVDGEVIKYTREGDGKMSHVNAKEVVYRQTRLKEPKDGMKYRNPAGVPLWPFFPPALQQKYNKGTPIENLILTEGAFKAMKGSLHGLDVVGLPSITCYKDKDTGHLYGDIIRLIEKCRVDRVVVLWDGDCLNISAKDLAAQSDLTSRPFSFYNAAKSIAYLVKKMPFEKTRDTPRCSFAHVKSEAWEERPKGLDDLLVVAGDKADQVARELGTMSGKDVWFTTFSITESTADMQDHFLIGFENAEDFYKRHSQQIGTTTFNFRGSMYKWNDRKDKLILLSPDWAKNIKWVGNDFFLDEEVPAAKGEMQRLLLPRKKGTIMDMLVRNGTPKNVAKEFTRYIVPYVSFVNIPDHLNHQQVIEVGDRAYYNRYFPFKHAPMEGTFEHIMGLVKHIFGDQDQVHPSGTRYKSWEMGLDYIQLLLTQPTQKLPVLILYSQENRTGKSSFTNMLRMLFGDNVAFVGNKDFESDFNEIFADKLLIVNEETSLERKAMSEKIKSMSTADRITVNQKGVAQYAIEFFGKFVFCTNNIRMVYLTEHDERYWILKVPTLKSEDPDYMAKVEKEIPAFVHFLTNRALHTPKENRMWFHPHIIRTDTRQEVVRVNEPALATEIRERITDWFIQSPGMMEIRMTLAAIKEEFGGKENDRWVQEVLRDYLKVDLLRAADNTAIHERGNYWVWERRMNSITGQMELERTPKPYRGRPYVFKRADFDREHITYTDTDDLKAMAETADKSYWEGAAIVEPEKLPF